ncbi:unnamed protein product [Vitrella brassicaformis CCMP3155]|uniref:Uncharacterized protein n=1 Tax=Vitrella brassicaformis (strain CCMP3155) TaxID=1169540 RepID=A0A0G4EA15_VITBC|nr:unnamed protein product [Vitrella brassicaformis CCMP3155]|eukprot:CEL92775.1 unnamed protein product [Vitrella brassicaformis CCMP3155]
MCMMRSSRLGPYTRIHRTALVLISWLIPWNRGHLEVYHSSYPFQILRKQPLARMPIAKIIQSRSPRQRASQAPL